MMMMIIMMTRNANDNITQSTPTVYILDTKIFTTLIKLCRLIKKKTIYFIKLHLYHKGNVSFTFL